MDELQELDAGGAVEHVPLGVGGVTVAVGTRPTGEHLFLAGEESVSGRSCKDGSSGVTWSTYWGARSISAAVAGESKLKIATPSYSAWPEPSGGVSIWWTCT
ncbi:hypothetical protein GCM10023259_039250 [Thermocatellispora tengchongensis]